MGIDLTKLTQGLNITKNAEKIAKNTGTQSVLGSKVNFNTGVLEKDTTAFTQGVKKAFPFTDKTTQVPEHHDINGYNTHIRDVFNKIKQGRTLGRSENFYLELAEEIDSQFAKLPPLEDDFVFYRGRAFNFGIERFNEDFRVIDATKPGDIIVPDKAYSYGAFKKELAKNWAYDMMMEIHTPKGAKVSRNLEHGGEVIFPRGAKYRLISKEKDEHGVLNVVLEYILPEK